MLVTQPRPHSPTRKRRRGRRQRAGVGGIDGIGQCVEERRVVAQEVGLAGQQGGDIALGHVVEQGQQLVADAVAPEGQIVVGRVAHGRQPDLGAQRASLGAAEAHDRVPSWAHAAESVDAGAPQKVEQHRLGLVVGRVPRQHARRQDGEARFPGPRLEVGTWRDNGALGSEAGAESCGGGGHHARLFTAPLA